MQHFENPDNFDRITYRMDHDLLKPLIDEATAQKNADTSNSPESVAFTPQGARNMYHINQTGRYGLGRAAVAMSAANMMLGLGYGVREDMSFEFESGGENFEMVINRLPGDRTGFTAIKDMVGLVLNKYTDHTKLQQIDKIGGTEYTATLFAMFLFLNKDIQTEQDAAKYMRTIWKFLETRFVDAWQDELSSKFRLWKTETDKFIEHEREGEMLTTAEAVVRRLGYNTPPGVTMPEGWVNAVKTFIELSEEMFEIQSAARWYSKPMPIDAMTHIRNRMLLQNIVAGASFVDLKNDPNRQLVKYRRLQLPQVHNGVLKNYPNKVHRSRAREALNRAAVENPWVELTKSTWQVGRDEVHRGLGINDLFFAIDRLVGDVKEYNEDADRSGAHDQKIEINTSAEGRARMAQEFNRIAMAQTVYNMIRQEQSANHPEDTQIWQADKLMEEIKAETDEVLRRGGPYNLFISEATYITKKEEYGQEKRDVVALPPGVGVTSQSEDKIKQIHESFDRLPKSLQLKYLLFALQEYGTVFHTGFGSYLPYISTTLLNSVLKAGEVYITDSRTADSLHYSNPVQRVMTGASLDTRPQPWSTADTIDMFGKVEEDKKEGFVGTEYDKQPEVTPTVENAVADTKGEGPLREMSNATANLLREAYRFFHVDASNILLSPLDERFGADDPKVAEGDGVETTLTDEEWGAYNATRHVPLNPTQVISWTLSNQAAARGEPPFGEEVKERVRKYAWLREQLTDLNKIKGKSRAAERAQMIDTIKSAVVKLAQKEDATPDEKAIGAAVMAYLAQDPLNADTIKKLRTKVRRDLKRREEVAARAQVEEVQMLLELEDAPPMDPGNDLFESSANGSIILTKLQRNAAEDMGSWNHRARRILLKQARMAEVFHHEMLTAANRWRKMAGARNPEYDRVWNLGDNIGEALLKVIPILYEAGVSYYEELFTTKVKVWGNDPKTGERKLIEKPLADVLYVFDPDTANVLRMKTPRGGHYYEIPDREKVPVIDVLHFYITKSKENKKLSAWEDILSDYSQTMEKSIAGINELFGYEKYKVYRNGRGDRIQRVHHVFQTTKRPWYRIAKPKSRLGEYESTDYLAKESYLSIFEHTGLVPRTFSAPENFIMWLNEATAAAKVQSTLQAVAGSTDVNGMPGMIIGTRPSEDGKTVRPFGEETGWDMLNALRTTLITAGAKPKMINRSGDPWVQAAEMANAHSETLEDIGYVKLKEHALGKDVTEIWTQMGATRRAVEFVATHDMRGKFQQAAEDKNVRLMMMHGASLAMLNAAKAIKTFQVGFSFFHTLALAESGVANKGLFFKWGPVFTPIHYVFSTVKGIKLFIQLTSQPELQSKWIGRGLKSDTLPLETMSMEIGQGWISRAGHQFYRIPIPGLRRLAGSTTLAAGNFKKFMDNLLWKVMLPTMKVSMAENMFKRFREMPELSHLSDEEIGQDVAGYVNDALGGQEWEKYMLSPYMQDVWNALFFAPDWSLSALNVAGVTKAFGEIFRMDGPMHFTDNEFDFTRSPMVRHRALRYLPGFVFNVLVAPPIAMQAMIYMLWGDPDEGDELWMFFNEKGKKTKVDFTPLLREYCRRKGIPPPTQRVYWTLGKQLREVLGWLNPLHTYATLWGKTSATLKILQLIFGQSKSAPGALNPWKVDPKDIPFEIFKMFIPFSVSGWMSDPEVPFAMRLTWPVSRGATKFSLARDMKKELDVMTDLKGPYMGLSVAEAQSMFDDRTSYIKDAAEKNQIPYEAIKTDAYKTARQEINTMLSTELVKRDPNWGLVKIGFLKLDMLSKSAAKAAKKFKTSIKYKIGENSNLNESQKEMLRNNTRSQEFYDARYDANEAWYDMNERGYDAQQF